MRLPYEEEKINRLITGVVAVVTILLLDAKKYIWLTSAHV